MASKSCMTSLVFGTVRWETIFIGWKSPLRKSAYVSYIWPHPKDRSLSLLPLLKCHTVKIPKEYIYIFIWDSEAKAIINRKLNMIHCTPGNVIPLLWRLPSNIVGQTLNIISHCCHDTKGIRLIGRWRGASGRRPWWWISIGRSTMWVG